MNEVATETTEMGIERRIEEMMQSMQTFEDWQEHGEEIITRLNENVRRGICLRYILGSWWVFGENRFGEEAYQVLEAAGVSKKTLQNAAWVAKKISPDTAESYSDLEFGHLEAVAKLEEDEQQKYLERAREQDLPVHKLRQEVRGSVDPQHQSNSNEWGTPDQYIELVRHVLGVIDLDPASSEFYNKTIRASRYFTEEDDGLKQPWYGKVFLNPPYGRSGNQSNAGIWSEKLMDEYENGDVEKAVLLVNSNTGERWFQPLLREYMACFPDHRIAFYNEGGSDDQPTRSNAFFFFGCDVEEVVNIFSEIGTVMARVRV